MTTIVGLAQAEGLQVIFRLDDPPTWAIGNEAIRGSQAPPSRHPGFRKFRGAGRYPFQGQCASLPDLE